MIRPTRAPDPLKPLKSFVPKFQMPRPLEDFDFGPKPIMGMSSTPKPSLFGGALGAISSGFSAYSAAGGTNFGSDWSSFTKSIGGSTVS